MAQVESTSASSSTEQRVIDGARRAIASGGWQSATLTRIAEEAGVSRMTLHRRGLGRDEIFALLARDYEEAFRAALWPAVTGKGTGAERLEAMLVAVCEVTEDHLDFLAALDEEADRRFFHESDDEVHSREGYINPIERLLADGIADGSIRRGRDRGDRDRARQRHRPHVPPSPPCARLGSRALARGADRPAAARPAARAKRLAQGGAA